jgi:hypothetical protein
MFYFRKNIEISKDEKCKEALNKYINRNSIPQDAEELFQCFCTFRIVDIYTRSCNYSNYFKYSYCKHVLSLMIIEEELIDPQPRAKATPERK